MNFRYFISPGTVIIFSLILLNVILNLFFEIRPIIEFFHYLENSNFLIGIPLSFSIPLFFLYIDRQRQKKILEEKMNLFKTTIHTIQDINNNFVSRKQLLLMDLEENNVDEKIIKEANNIVKETQELVKMLSKIDPFKTNISHLNENISLFKLSIKIVLLPIFLLLYLSCFVWLEGNFDQSSQGSGCADN